ncbi:ABC transporter permease [Rubinisphaera sp.]|uniref:ABC transporter permease n=1 Tax=Rubinisphaera sp. TaxID=2024857 RepID=UPI000C0C9B44|nr:ABC transporter permease [Rubinisphaera sp.]MBV08966.1 sugar ABC transporter permease [Rubinisphaera sp.]|tara:strand:- start:303 stop:1298 length:996 start_codon:yes stop_codon:yes gene_type:complete
MKKILGILGLLIFVCVITAINNPKFLLANNIEQLLHRTALFGIISLGAAFVIMTGGIDLSIGSVIGLTGSLMPLLLVEKHWSVPGTIAFVGSLSLVIGLAHGLLITKLKIQPFIVTLCGLLLYRGLARWVTEDSNLRFGSDYPGLMWFVKSKLEIGLPVAIPVPAIIFLILAILSWIFLNRTIWGRHLMALGRNEQAARFSGIATDRLTILAYVFCAGLAGLGGVLFALDQNTVQPSAHGNFYELYAIAAAVLGGCSLRGGEGSIIGVAIGAALLRVLYNAIIMADIPSQLDFAIIGMVILGGVIADELIKRYAARKRLQAARMQSTKEIS